MMMTIATLAIFALLAILATVIGLDELDTYEAYWPEFITQDVKATAQEAKIREAPPIMIAIIVSTPSYLDLLLPLEIVDHNDIDVDESWLAFV